MPPGDQDMARMCVCVPPVPKGSSGFLLVPWSRMPPQWTSARGVLGVADGIPDEGHEAKT